MRKGPPDSDRRQDQGRDGEQHRGATPGRSLLLSFDFLIRGRFGRIEFGRIEAGLQSLDRTATSGICAQAAPRNGSEGLGHGLRHDGLRTCETVPLRRALRENFNKRGAKRPKIGGWTNDSICSFRGIIHGSCGEGSSRHACERKTVGRELEAIAGSHNVRWLEAAVNKALAMQIGERVQSGCEQFARFFL